MQAKSIARFIALSAIFLVPVFPLIVIDYMFFPFITGKAFYFRILVEIGFAAWVILACFEPKYRPKISALSIGVTVFALVALLADLLGVNPIRSIVSNFERMEGWLVIAHLWMFYMVASSIFSNGDEGRRMWHRWINVSLFIATIVGIYGFIQLLGWADIHQGSSRIDASLGNAIYMAVYMLFHSFFAAYMYFRQRTLGDNGVLVGLYAFLAIFFGFLLFATSTRGTILGFIGGIMVALAAYAVCGRGEKNMWRYISGGIIAGIILLGVVFWMNRDLPFIQKNETLRRLASISIRETQTQARGFIWPMAIEGWQERPILGWGQENFSYVFNANYNPKMWSHEQWFDRAHNVYLDWLIAGGAIGLVSYLALYVLLLLAVWRTGSLSIKEKSVITGLVAGYAVHNIFVFDNLASYAMFFGTLAFAGSLVKGKERAKGHAHAHAHAHGRTLVLFGNEPMKSDVVEYVVAPVVIVLLAVMVYFVDIRQLQANVRLIGALKTCGATTGSGSNVENFERALAVNAYVGNQEIREQLIQCTYRVIQGQYPNPVKMAYLEKTKAEITKQLEATPNDARTNMFAGSLYMEVGDFAEAEKLLGRALELSPGKQTIMLQLATAYINSGKTSEAVELLKKAYESEPSFEEARMAYAVSLVIAGREAEARKLFSNDPAIFETERMAQVYSFLKQYQKAIGVYNALIAKDPTNIDLRANLAQLQYTAGMTWAAVQTLQAIAVEKPEYKAQIDATIKQMQK